MKITVNGKVIETLENKSLRDFVLSCKVKPDAVIVVLNETVIRKEIWTDKVLTEGDSIELVSLVGGG